MIPLITKVSVNTWIKLAGFSTFNKVKNHWSRSRKILTWKSMQTRCNILETVNVGLTIRLLRM